MIFAIFLNFAFGILDSQRVKKYLRLVPVINLLQVAKQRSCFPLQLFWCIWFCKLWKDSLKKSHQNLLTNSHEIALKITFIYIYH